MHDFNSNIATDRTINTNLILAEIENSFSSNDKIEHEEVFQEILENLEQIDFRGLGRLDNEQKVTQKLQIVLTIQTVQQIANELDCGLCRNQDFMYTYNGEFWRITNRDELERFLGEASEKCGVSWIAARFHKFKNELYKQFVSAAYFPTPEKTNDSVLINLKNGTFEISERKQSLRSFNRYDFLTYQLGFDYDHSAKSSKWQSFLDEVLPEVEKQMVLAEYLGYVFARHLKLEKTLILYGTGANGKSVIFDVIQALFGKENLSHYSLESLGKDYFRAMIANKLLNYSSEISCRLNSEKFKQMTSGEPMEARLPYGQPMTLTNYARLMFNSNELPKDVEHSNAFFRRFLIIPFDVTIPEHKQNKNLAREIIESELSGVFNWILSGLKRLLSQGNFTHSEASESVLMQYKQESDSVAMFINDQGYEASNENQILLKDLYQVYREFCQNDGYKALGKRNFKKRLEGQNIVVECGNGNRVFVWLKSR